MIDTKVFSQRHDEIDVGDIDGLVKDDGQATTTSSVMTVEDLVTVIEISRIHELRDHVSSTRITVE